MDHEDEADIGGEGELFGKEGVTQGLLGGLGKQRAAPLGQKELWEGLYGGEGKSRIKVGLTGVEDCQTQAECKKRDATKGTQLGKAMGNGGVADRGRGLLYLNGSQT